MAAVTQVQILVTTLTSFCISHNKPTLPPTPTPTSTSFCFYLIKGKKLLLRIFFFKFYREFSFFFSFFLSFFFSFFHFLLVYLFVFTFLFFLFAVNKNVKKKNAIRPRAAKFCKLTVQSRRGWGGERKKNDRDLIRFGFRPVSRGFFAYPEPEREEGPPS